MSSGPLRQGVGVLGLLALTPTMVSVAMGRMPTDEAAVRAVVTLLVVIVFGRVLAMSLRYYVRLAERGGTRLVGATGQRKDDDHAE